MESTKTKEIENLSKLIDDVSLFELNDYLKKIKDFEKIVDELYKDESKIEEKFNTIKSNIDEMNKFVNSKGKEFDNIHEKILEDFGWMKDDFNDTIDWIENRFKTFENNTKKKLEEFWEGQKELNNYIEDSINRINKNFKTTNWDIQNITEKFNEERKRTKTMRIISIIVMIVIAIFITILMINK